MSSLHQNHHLNEEFLTNMDSFRSEKEKRPISHLENLADELLQLEDFSYAHYDENSNNLLFEPCVYSQRYQKVFDILINAKWRKDIKVITEYGCGEYRLLKYFEHFLSLRKINFIDVDENILEKNLGNLRLCDYHYMNRRLHPLQVNVFHGSISDADIRILNSDVVIGVEIIEHLFPDTLEAIPYIIFQVVMPKIVIFTTPNADFNVAFNNSKKFRHPDHKFEWTREQFESWSKNITLRFPNYTVKFFGVGKGPVGTESLGCCSQLALFIRKDVLNLEKQQEKFLCGEDNFSKQTCQKCFSMQPFGICTYLSHSKIFKKQNDSMIYRAIYTTDYQYRDNDEGTDDSKLLKILINNMNYQTSNVKVVDVIPLNKIISTYTFGVFISEEEAGSILTSHGFDVRKYPVEDTNKQISRKWMTCVKYCAQRIYNDPIS